MYPHIKPYTKQLIIVKLIREYTSKLCVRIVKFSNIIDLSMFTGFVAELAYAIF